MKRLGTSLALGLLLALIGTLALSFGALAASRLTEEVQSLQKEWAILKYQLSNEDQKLQGLSDLEDKAVRVSDAYPGAPEPLIWEAIIVSTRAELLGGLSGLHEAERARALLKIAEKANPSALHGVAYTCLGVLYYKVPPWPVGFGDTTLAKTYLEKGLAQNPDGIDSNYFYGDFLSQTGDTQNARKVLEHALAVSQEADPGDVAIQGRRAEIQHLLLALQQ
jgi:hypothetical protein